MQLRPATGNVPRTRLKGAIVFISAFALLAGFNAAHAESLREALATAYLYNPTLKAARAQLRATDEEVARAKSGFRPTITGDLEASYQDVKSSPPRTTVDGDSYPRSATVTLNQPVFRGFRTINAVRGAEALVEAGREDLRVQEASVLLDAITSYVDVVRDQAILSLRQNNVKVLGEQLRATQERFDVGEVTRTDVAQARARNAGRVAVEPGELPAAHRPRSGDASRSRSGKAKRSEKHRRSAVARRRAQPDHSRGDLPRALARPRCEADRGRASAQCRSAGELHAFVRQCGRQWRPAGCHNGDGTRERADL
jgi:hypothetical protein